MKEEKVMLYFAYGSNLNVAAMKRRCPRSRKVGALILPDARLVFRHVADVEYSKGSRCPGGLWRITDKCEETLDRYEGVEGGLYSKIYIRLLYNGKERRCLVYQMNENGIAPPGEGYLSTIAQGYRDFGLDLGELDQALWHAWDEKNRTPKVNRRIKRRKDRPLAYNVFEVVMGGSDGLRID
jgi:hypothetical protein